MKTNIRMKILLLTTLLGSSLYGATSTNTLFKTANPYENNAFTEGTLNINLSECPSGYAEVHVQGALEKDYDFITIDGMKLTGKINEVIPIKTDTVNYTFISDYYVSDEGVTAELRCAESICMEVVTLALNPITKEKKEFPNSCLPEGWIKIDPKYNFYETDHPYKNDTFEQGTLKINPDICSSGYMEVDIQGSLEDGYDFITVGDKKFTGKIDEQLILEGNSVDYTFTSDYYVLDEGVRVELRCIEP